MVFTCPLPHLCLWLLLSTQRGLRTLPSCGCSSGHSRDGLPIPLHPLDPGATPAGSPSPPCHGESPVVPSAPPWVGRGVSVVGWGEQQVATRAALSLPATTLSQFPMSAVLGWAVGLGVPPSHGAGVSETSLGLCGDLAPLVCVCRGALRVRAVRRGLMARGVCVTPVCHCLSQQGLPEAGHAQSSTDRVTKSSALLGAHPHTSQPRLCVRVRQLSPSL